MKISDETLSAFLDAELPEQEMDRIRDCIACDEVLADRLEALAMVDATLRGSYQTIDQQPMPAAITKLLQQASATDNSGAQLDTLPKANTGVVSGWRQLAANSLKPAAIAACLSFVMGYGLATLYSQSPAAVNKPQSYQQLLSHTPSGERVVEGDGWLQVNLSFANQQGQLCRHFTEQSGGSASDNIACYSDQQWQLLARHPRPVDSGGEYRAASGPTALDTLIDQLIAGPVKTPEQEQQFISRGWQATNQQ